MTADAITTTIATSVATGVIGFFCAFLIQERRLRTELRTELAAVRAITALLQHERWGKRSFHEISKRLGGFGDDELRKMLVLAGAVRFEKREDNEELWGLLSRNTTDL